MAQKTVAGGVAQALKGARARGENAAPAGTAPKPELADDCREARRERRNDRRGNASLTDAPELKVRVRSCQEAIQIVH